MTAAGDPSRRWNRSDDKGLRRLVVALLCENGRVTGFLVRRATVDDVDVVARHRVAMFRDMGEIASETLEQVLLEASTKALAVCLANATYLGWLATDAGGAVRAGAGVQLRSQLPRIAMDGKRVETGPAPLVLNVYTEPEWRRRGLARVLMQHVMAWAADTGLDRLVLRASNDGRPLYEALGFAATNEMSWDPRRFRRMD
jgi:GNAT superfamily N-acetyltransferase